MMWELYLQDGDFEVSTRITSDWKSGYNGEIRITNISDKVIEDWTIEFDFLHNIDRFYTAEILSHTDNHYIVKNVGYNANINPGQTITLGFSGNPGDISEEIENVKLKQVSTTLEDLYWDSDNDGLPDVVEYDLGTDPYNIDTDGDGIDDYTEVMLGLNPLSIDTDGNGVLDGDEDLDGDGLTVLQELEHGTNNLLSDTDGDELSDYDEIFIYGTSPLVADTDGDGLSDYDEILLGLDPTNPRTFGVPDSEYKVPQYINSESEIFSNINNEDSPYKISIDISASGYVEDSLIARETRYAKTISNDSIIGIAPELLYKDSDNATFVFNQAANPIYVSCSEYSGFGDILEFEGQYRD